MGKGTQALVKREDNVDEAKQQRKKYAGANFIRHKLSAVRKTQLDDQMQIAKAPFLRMVKLIANNINNTTQRKSKGYRVVKVREDALDEIISLYKNKLSELVSVTDVCCRSKDVQTFMASTFVSAVSIDKIYNKQQQYHNMQHTLESIVDVNHY